jgi:hypothetical protein
LTENVEAVVPVVPVNCVQEFLVTGTISVDLFGRIAKASLLIVREIMPRVPSHNIQAMHDMESMKPHEVFVWFGGPLDRRLDGSVKLDQVVFRSEEVSCVSEALPRGVYCGRGILAVNVCFVAPEVAA